MLRVPVSRFILYLGFCALITVSMNACGGASTTPMTQSNAVTAPPPQPKVQGTTVANIEKRSDWQSCDTCAGVEGLGPAGEHGMVQGVASPSRDGAASQFWLAGSI